MTHALITDPVLSPLAKVSRRHGLDSLASRLSPLTRWLNDGSVSFEEALRTNVDDRDLAMRAARYLLERPGKRIRPVCVVLAARLGGRDLDPRVRELAIAAELVHAATLLHDDVIDQGAERRGAPASRVVYGNAASVLGGDYLLIDALQRTQAVANPTLMTHLLEVVAQMVRAEALQLEARGNFVPDREAYMRVAVGKTAALFEWSLIAGATLGGLSPEQSAACGSLGSSLGLAFQLVDDVLDLGRESSATGKSVLLDLREGKATWPIIEAAHIDPSLKLDLRRLAQGERFEDASLEMLRDRVEATGALDTTRRAAQGYAASAELALDRLPAVPARDALASVVKAAVSRTR